MTSSPGPITAITAAANPSMAPTATRIWETSASTWLSRLSFLMISSRNSNRPAFSLYPPTSPSLMAAIAPSLIWSGVSEVGFAQDRNATSSTSFDSLVISWMADLDIRPTLFDIPGLPVISCTPFERSFSTPLFHARFGIQLSGT